MGAIINFAYNKTINKNENFIAVIIGATGSGKSYSFISFAQKFQEKHKSSNIYIIFKHEELLKLLLPGKNTIKKGDIVIYEEMGISADHRKWWGITNDTIRYVSQIARNRNFLFLMNLPFLSLLDKDVLPLVHVLFETLTKIVEKRIVRCRLLFNDVNHRSGKSYFKYPMVFIKEIGDYRKIKNVDIIHPEEEIKRSNISSLSEYERIKNEFNNSVYQKLLDTSTREIIKLENKNKKTDINDIAEKVIKNKDEFIREYGGYSLIDQNKIALEYGLGHHASKSVKRYVEDKLGIGYGTKTNTKPL